MMTGLALRQNMGCRIQRRECRGKQGELGSEPIGQGTDEGQRKNQGAGEAAAAVGHCRRRLKNLLAMLSLFIGKIPLPESCGV